MPGPDRLPPLNPARAFEVTGRLSSISKAAEELSVTPAAVSRQVRALERFLGVALFRRVHGGLELTDVGTRYLAELTPLFSALGRATDAARHAARPRKSLRISSPATFAVRWLIPRLAGFHELHGDIDVRLTTSARPLDLDRDGVDAGITLGDGQWPGLRAQRLVRNELVPVMSADRASTLDVSSPDALREVTLLHSLARTDDWSLWLRAAGVDGVDAFSGMKYETSLLAYQAALEGHGIAIAQKALVEKDLAAGSLVAPFAFVLDRGDHTYYFAWPAGGTSGGVLRVFCDWLAALVVGNQADLDR